MIKKGIMSLVFSLVAAPVFAQPISGPVGQVSGVSHTPSVVVFDDALITFYQTNSEKLQISFSIATADESGDLIWDPMTYTIDSNVIHSEKVAPQPVLLNNTLYVFGRGAEGNLIYNSVDTLDQLIAGEWNNHALISIFNGDALTRLSENINEFSALEYAHGGLDIPDAEKKRKILLAYYEKDANNKFSYLTCFFESKLICEGEKVHYETGSKNFKGAPLLLNEFSYKNVFPFPVMYIQDDKGVLTKQMFTPKDGFGMQYEWYNNSNYDIPKSLVEASSNPIGVAQYADENGIYSSHLYYRQSGANAIKKSSQSLANNGLYEWNEGSKLGLSIGANHGVKTIVYKDRAYVFYVEKGTEMLKYYSDMFAQAPLLP